MYQLVEAATDLGRGWCKTMVTTRHTRQCWLLVLLLSGVACGSPADRTRKVDVDSLATEEDSIQQDSSFLHLIRWGFEPVEGERSHLDSLLHLLGQRRDGPYFRGGGALFRLSDSSRYLLVAFRPEKEGTKARVGRGEVILYVLGDPADQDQTSEPFDQDIPDLDVFSLEEIRDFDGDGLADVAYCRWVDSDFEEDVPTGVPTIVGYRAGEWYFIQQAHEATSRCGQIVRAFPPA